MILYTHIGYMSSIKKLQQNFQKQRICCSVNQFLFNEISSLTRKNAEITAAKRSAAGPAYIIPSIPINIGRIISRGKRKMICLVSDKNVPFAGFPIDEKNVDDIG